MLWATAYWLVALIQCVGGHLTQSLAPILRKLVAIWVDSLHVCLSEYGLAAVSNKPPVPCSAHTFLTGAVFLIFPDPWTP